MYLIIHRYYEWITFRYEEITWTISKRYIGFCLG